MSLLLSLLSLLLSLLLIYLFIEFIQICTYIIKREKTKLVQKSQAIDQNSQSQEKNFTRKLGL